MCHRGKSTTYNVSFLSHEQAISSENGIESASICENRKTTQNFERCDQVSVILVDFRRFSSILVDFRRFLLNLVDSRRFLLIFVNFRRFSLTPIPAIKSIIYHSSFPLGISERNLSHIFDFFIKPNKQPGNKKNACLAPLVNPKSMPSFV